MLLGGGSFLVFPQWRRNTLPGNVVDTTLQVRHGVVCAVASLPLVLLLPLLPNNLLHLPAHHLARLTPLECHCSP